jgi:hypothetical protein
MANKIFAYVPGIGMISTSLDPCARHHLQVRVVLANIFAAAS